ncbi:MAG: MFS transporter [Trueperaceae bacterium]|nr:MFS transporter [Trueperaceae bacterium]
MPQRFQIFTVFLFAYFLSYFFRSTNAIIADDLVRDLGLSASELGLMTSLFFAAFALAQLPIGSALDRFGPRWVVPAFMLAGAAGSLLFAAAANFTMLALGRALIGLGMAGVLAGSFKALGGWFAPRRFATISSVFVGFGASGSLVAATPLAWLSEAFGWRTVFWVGAFVIVASAAAITVWSRNPPEVDVDRPREGSFADIFRDRQFWQIALLGFMMVGSLFAYQTLWIGPFLREAVGLGRIAAGDMLFTLGVGVIVGYLVCGYLADRLGLERVIAVFAALFFVSQAALGLFGPDWPGWALGATCASFGFFGAYSILLYTHVRNVFPVHMSGRAVTATNLLAIGGGAILQWLLGVIIALFTPDASGSYPASAYRTIFVLTAGAGIASVLFYLPLAIRPVRRPPEDVTRTV